MSRNDLRTCVPPSAVAPRPTGLAGPLAGLVALLLAGCSGGAGTGDVGGDLPDTDDVSADTNGADTDPDVTTDANNGDLSDAATDTQIDDASSDTEPDTDDPGADTEDELAPDATPEPDTSDDAAGDTTTDTTTDTSSDTTTDAAPDTSSDTTSDAAPDASCAYSEIDTRIASCGDGYVYLGLFRDIGETGGDCPDYWQARTDDGQHATPEAAASAAACDATCVWQAAMSVSWLRCGVRSGYIRFDSATCDSLYEMPEGLFTSLEAHDQAHPCPSRPAGQCVTSADCPGISICSSSAPGGICTGCGSFDDCPDSADECSEFGACRRMCDVDEECPAGQSCGVTGYCVIAQCVRGACPDARFDCNAGSRCERRACSEPDAECPAGTACTSGYCVVTR